MEQLRQSQQECAQKDRNIHDLNERFQQIQRGLGAIDAERESLKKEIHDLTRQQQDLRRELQMREKEVQTLVRRCKEEETKVKEATRIRSENRSYGHLYRFVSLTRSKPRNCNESCNA